MLRVLPLLHNVARVELFTSEEGEENGTQILTESLSHALQQTIFPTIKTLSIHNSPVSITVLASFCPVLVHLILDNVFPSVHLQSREPLPPVPLPLHILQSIIIDRYAINDFHKTSSLTSLLCRVQHTLNTMLLGRSLDIFLLENQRTFLEQFGHSLDTSTFASQFPGATITNLPHPGSVLEW